MKNLRVCRHLPVFLAFFLFAILTALPSTAWSPRLLKVGLYRAAHYSYSNPDGSFGGADVEFAYRIAQKAGFSIQIFLFDNDPDMLEALDSGSVDVLFDFGKTKERRQHYLFSENQVGSTALSVYARQGDSRFVYGDIEQLAGKRFGCESGSSVSTTFASWCRDHDLNPNIIEYKDRIEIDRALNSGEIDAGIIGQNGHTGYVTIMTFSPRPYYLMFRKTDAALKNAVDSAMNHILANDPLYEGRLLEKYNISSFGIIGFSAEEKRYITAHPQIRLAVIRNDLPYYSHDSTGKAYGIIPDYYARLEDFIGLKFSFCEYNSTPEAIEAVKSGKADVLAMFSDGIIVGADDGLLLTDAYQNVDSVVLTRAGTGLDGIKKIAVKQRSVNNARQGIASILKAEIVPVANADAGFAELRSGKVDALVCGLPTATWLLNQTNPAAYSTSILSSLSFDLCGGTAAGNMVLVGILDKGISATNYGFEGIIDQNTRQARGWQSIIARIPPVQIVIISCILVSIIILLCMAIITIIRRQRERNALESIKAQNEKKQMQLKAIEKNTEERNQFFSNISHDMRTPLNAIIGFVHLARKEDVPPSLRSEYLEKAESSGELLLDLINDTLTISKISSGKMELHPQPCRADELIESVVFPIRAAAEKKKIDFTVDCSKLPYAIILADKLSFEKIFLNLLSNAVKYTPVGGHIWFTAVQESRQDSMLNYLMIVRDNGIGMTGEFIAHAFEPFTQEKRHGYESVGTGLGLSIVKQLVALMDGQISVESHENAGSLFTVRLHFREVKSEQDTAIRQAASAPVSLLGRKVLLCEDNQLNREIAVALLKEKGVIIDCAENGQIGLDIFSRSGIGEYMAILMDIRMPVMDGYATTEAIRALNRPDAKHIPIIAMTADAFEEDLRKCLRSGMNSHISKPINPDTLMAELCKFQNGSDR